MKKVIIIVNLVMALVVGSVFGLSKLGVFGNNTDKKASEKSIKTSNASAKKSGKSKSSANKTQNKMYNKIDTSNSNKDDTSSKSKSSSNTSGSSTTKKTNNFTPRVKVNENTGNTSSKSSATNKANSGSTSVKSNTNRSPSTTSANTSNNTSNNATNYASNNNSNVATSNLNSAEFEKYTYIDEEGRKCFKYTGTGHSTIVIPEGVEVVAGFTDDQWSFNDEITAVVIPKSVTNIMCSNCFNKGGSEGNDDYNFYDVLYQCRNLKSVTGGNVSYQCYGNYVKRPGGIITWSTDARHKYDINDYINVDSNKVGDDILEWSRRNR